MNVNIVLRNPFGEVGSPLTQNEVPPDCVGDGAVNDHPRKEQRALSRIGGLLSPRPSCGPAEVFYCAGTVAWTSTSPRYFPYPPRHQGKNVHPQTRRRHRDQLPLSARSPALRTLDILATHISANDSGLDAHSCRYNSCSDASKTKKPPSYVDVTMIPLSKNG